MDHGTHSHQPKENKTIIPFKNGFWLVVIIVGLFIAALNFIQAEKGGEEGEGKEKTEMKGGHEATGEKEGKKAEEVKKTEEAKPVTEAPAAEKPAAEHK